MQENTGASALCIASQNGHIEVVRELITKGAQIDMQTNTGASALCIASLNGHIEVVRELIAKGAQIDMQTNNGCICFMYSQSKWTY